MRSLGGHQPMRSEKQPISCPAALCPASAQQAVCRNNWHYLITIFCQLGSFEVNLIACSTSVSCYWSDTTMLQQPISFEELVNLAVTWGVRKSYLSPLDWSLLRMAILYCFQTASLLRHTTPFEALTIISWGREVSISEVNLPSIPLDWHWSHVTILTSFSRRFHCSNNSFVRPGSQHLRGEPSLPSSPLDWLSFNLQWVHILLLFPWY